jgi:hypothetical protein
MIENEIYGKNRFLSLNFKFIVIKWYDCIITSFIKHRKYRLLWKGLVGLSLEKNKNKNKLNNAGIAVWVHCHTFFQPDGCLSRVGFCRGDYKVDMV